MALNDIFQMTVVGQLHGQTVMNTLHYKQLSSGPAPGSAVMTAFRSLFEVSYLNCLSAEYELTTYAWQKIAPGAPEAPYVTPVGFTTGNGNANSLPSVVSAVITKRTLLAGKKNRGRIYVPAVPVDFEINSKITLGAFGTYQALSAVLASQFTTSGAVLFEPCVYHRSTKTSDPITSCLARDNLRTQRRRGVGVGI